MDIIFYKKFFPDWILAGTTTREFGDVSIRDKTNKERLAEILHISKDRLVSLRQEHTTVINEFVPYGIKEIYIGNDRGKETGDGLFTKEKNICLLIKTADCVPMLAVETQKRMIMALHLGRIGSLSGMIKKGMEKIVSFGGDLAFLKVLLGPHIENKCYMMDLAQTNKKQLLDAGVKEENILLSRDCTFCQTDKFFSHRKGDSQRMGTFIMMI